MSLPEEPKAVVESSEEEGQIVDDDEEDDKALQSPQKSPKGDR